MRKPFKKKNLKKTKAKNVNKKVKQKNKNGIKTAVKAKVRTKKRSETKKKKENKKTFILSTILITAVIFIFFQIAIYFERSQSKQSFQIDLDSQTNQSTILDKKESFSKNLENEAEVENNSLVEKVQKEQTKDIDEIKSLKKDRSFFEEVIDDSTFLRDKADIEMQKMTDDGDFFEQDRLANQFDNDLLDKCFETFSNFNKKQYQASKDAKKQDKTLLAQQTNEASYLKKDSDVKMLKMMEKSFLSTGKIQNKLISYLDDSLLNKQSMTGSIFNETESTKHLKNDQNLFEKKPNDITFLQDQTDFEIQKMVDENAMIMKKEFANFLNKHLLNGRSNVREKKSFQNIISKKKTQKTKSSARCFSKDSRCNLLKNKICVPKTKICDVLKAGYNASARINICGGIKSFITVDFIYWELLADQLDLGTINITSPSPQEFKVLKFKTVYHPGFKVGVGTYFKKDDWDLFVQYTRLNKTETTFFNPANKTGTFYTAWFLTSVGSFNLSNISTDIKAVWKMDLDKIDIELGRSYYLSKWLIVRPFISLSSHILDQRYELSLTTNQLYSSLTKNDSWSIGPRFGISTNWILYKGFKLFGYGALSLLFAENEIKGSGEENLIIYNVEKVDKYILRDVQELKLGIGWESYFTHDKWHIDITAAYEAQRYSHTNYMSYISQINTEGNEIKSGDLYVHGLTLSARFDF